MPFVHFFQQYSVKREVFLVFNFGKKFFVCFQKIDKAKPHFAAGLAKYLLFANEGCGRCSQPPLNLQLDAVSVTLKPQSPQSLRQHREISAAITSKSFPLMRSRASCVSRINVFVSVCACISTWLSVACMCVCVSGPYLKVNEGGVATL